MWQRPPPSPPPSTSASTCTTRVPTGAADASALAASCNHPSQIRTSASARRAPKGWSASPSAHGSSWTPEPCAEGPLTPPTRWRGGRGCPPPAAAWRTRRACRPRRATTTPPAVARAAVARGWGRRQRSRSGTPGRFAPAGPPTPTVRAPARTTRRQRLQRASERAPCRTRAGRCRRPRGSAAGCAARVPPGASRVNSRGRCPSRWSASARSSACRCRTTRRAHRTWWRGRRAARWRRAGSRQRRRSAPRAHAHPRQPRYQTDVRIASENTDIGRPNRSHNAVGGPSAARNARTSSTSRAICATSSSTAA